MSSKYSALPDIDTQPDVYETPDSPDEAEVSDDGFLNVEEPNDDIVRDKISVGEAVDKFKGSETNGDESEIDRSTRHKKHMYKKFVNQAYLENEYEIVPRDPTLLETPIQKLRRLMFEVQELGEEIEKKKEDSELSQIPQNSQSVLSNLNNELTRFSQSLGDTDISDDKDGAIIKQAELGKRLINQLQTFKNMGMPKENGISEPKDGSINGEPMTNGIMNESAKNMVTYELYYSPETTRVHTLAKTVDLDDRISALEKFVGTAHGQSFEDLSISITNTNLIAAVDKLDQQMQILSQPRHLESVSRKAKTLVGELEKVNELKSKELSNGGVIAFETEENIKYLFALLDKLDPLMSIAPALVNRLKSLQQLHQEAAVFSETINMLSNEQNKITVELKSLDDVAAKLENSLQVNNATINRNVEAVDNRVTELAERIDKLLSNHYPEATKEEAIQKYIESKQGGFGGTLFMTTEGNRVDNYEGIDFNSSDIYLCEQTIQKLVKKIWNASVLLV
ncbi:16785_t:CDS:10 [Funneliformis geosporum]|nr:16785_t:CDS:10 [Funneliformis geosporum]